MKCKATKDDGTPCRALEHLVDETTQLCPAHSKGGRQRMSKRARSRKGTLELPPLTSHEAASESLDLIARAVASGRISNQKGATLGRLVESWLKSEGARMVADDVERQNATIKALRKQAAGKPLNDADRAALKYAKEKQDR